MKVVQNSDYLSDLPIVTNIKDPFSSCVHTLKIHSFYAALRHGKCFDIVLVQGRRKSLEIGVGGITVVGIKCPP